MQFQADLLNVPVLRPKDTEITAKGAALLAGLKNGLYDDQTIKESWKVDQIFEPQMPSDRRAQHIDKWQQVIAKALMEV
ncbi:glycerol kinase, partial [Psychrobacter sp. 1U2]